MSDERQRQAAPRGAGDAQTMSKQRVLSPADEAELASFIADSWGEVSGMKGFNYEAAASATGGGVIDHDKTTIRQIDAASWVRRMCTTRDRMRAEEGGEEAWAVLRACYRLETQDDRNYLPHGILRARVVRMTPSARARGREMAEETLHGEALARCLQEARVENPQPLGIGAKGCRLSSMAVAQRVLACDAAWRLAYTSSVADDFAGRAVRQATEKGPGHDAVWITSVRHEADEMIANAGHMWTVARWSVGAPAPRAVERQVHAAEVESYFASAAE